ncbi:MAG: hypothetical protein WCC00_14990 [Candidatus Aminicenantales bacterium]
MVIKAHLFLVQSLVVERLELSGSSLGLGDPLQSKIGHAFQKQRPAFAEKVQIPSVNSVGFFAFRDGDLRPPRSQRRIGHGAAAEPFGASVSGAPELVGERGHDPEDLLVAALKKESGNEAMIPDVVGLRYFLLDKGPIFGLRPGRVAP